MKYFFSEYPAEYAKYRFPYQVYVKKEAADKLNDIYAQGFLPTRLHKDVFILSRQLRIKLSDFTPSSENRRILRKTENIQCTIEVLSRFPYDYTIGKMAKDFYEQKFGQGTMSAQKMKWLFKESSCTHVAVFKDQDKVVGYCLLVRTALLTHYAYPFYDLNYPERSIGLGMMLQVILNSLNQAHQYMYLGTIYTAESMYKLQFSGLEYFTGWNWSKDLEALKKLIAEPTPVGHMLETMPDKQEFFNQL